MDLTVEAKIYKNGAFEPCCIGIDQGKITSIKKILKGDEHCNFGKKIILPAGIDLHVHFRDPGFPQKEDFSTGSLAAAYGGIGCVFDMPNTNPQTSTVRTIVEKINRINQKSYVDFGVYSGVTDTNIDCLSEIAKHCSGFKAYLGSTTNSLQLSENNLQKAFQEISKTKKILLVHAENESCLQKHAGVERNLLEHLKRRPSECEEISIKNILAAGREVKSRTHICHLSSCEGFELIRNKPKYVSVGVTPHHLLFDVDHLNTTQSCCKVNPPIRTHFDREMLWYGITNGIIDVIESDHAPHAVNEKQGDFDMIPSGIPGVETTYPLFLAMVKNNELSLERLLSLQCERPAQIMNIPKGKIEVGHDADFIIIDFKKTTKISSDHLHSKCGWTPYEDISAIFPSDVFVRGERIIEEYQLMSKPGIGENVELGVQ